MCDYEVDEEDDGSSNQVFVTQDEPCRQCIEEEEQYEAEKADQ